MKKEQILSFIGDLVDLYQESESIVIENNPGNMTADFEELEARCAGLISCAEKMVA